MNIILAGCVDPVMIGSFVGASLIAIVCGTCGLLLGHPKRLAASGLGFACSIVVFSILVSDGLFRQEFHLLSIGGLMAFGPMALNIAGLVRSFVSRR